MARTHEADRLSHELYIPGQGSPPNFLSSEDDDSMDEREDSNTPKVIENHNNPATMGRKVVEHPDFAKTEPAHGTTFEDSLIGDDRRILELWRLGHNAEAICDILTKEGHPNFKKDAVSRRILRMSRAIEKEEDERLDDELSDWHEGEDEKLEQAVQSADERLQIEIQKLEDRKWENVAILLADRLTLDKKKYTGKACKERWEALQSGTALKPIELDSDQEGRKHIREARIAEAKHLRAAEKEEANQAKEKEAWAKGAKKREKEAKALERKAEAEARNAEKAEAQRIRAERKAGKDEKVAARRQAQHEWRAEIDEKRRIRELEERVYRSITGKSLNRMRRVALNGNTDGAKDEADDADDGSDHESSLFIGDDEVDDHGPMSGLESDHSEDQFPDDISDNEDDNNITVAYSNPNTPAKRSRRAGPPPNPRSILTGEELRVLLHQRALPRRGDNESHPEVVARLDAADHSLSSAALSELLEKYFDRTKGSKEVKIAKLQGYDAANSAAGMRGDEGAGL